MSKNIFYPLLILLSLCAFRVDAQRNNRTNAEETKPNQLFELLPVPGKGYINIYTDHPETPSKILMEFIGPAQTVEATKEISLIRRGLSAMIESAFIWNGELTLITSLFYPGPQRDLLFIRRYSLPDFEEVASEKIAEAYVPGRLRIPFGYALSPDSTNIMFYSWTYAVPEDPVKMEIHVLDRQLERQWTKRFLLPNKNANFYIYACKVDNDANAYLLCEDYKGKVGGRINEEKIERFVLRLDENSDEATSFVIKLQDKVITDLRFTMDDEGNLYGGGLYRQPNKVNQDGVFVYRIDQKTQGFQKKEIPINKGDYQAMHAYADASGKHVSGTRQFRDYFLDKVVWNDQQGLMLVGEQRIYDDDEDRYRDILVVQLDPDLRKKWMLRIPKSQVTFWGQPYFASYCFLERDGKQYVIFNDHQDNMATDEVRPSRIKTLSMNLSFNLPKPFIHMIQITPEGKLKHQNLSMVIKQPDRMALFPSMTRSDGRNSFLLYLNYLNEVVDEPGLVFPISWVKE